jgi:hypothetical protein
MLAGTLPYGLPLQQATLTFASPLAHVPLATSGGVATVDDPRCPPL